MIFLEAEEEGSRGGRRIENLHAMIFSEAEEEESRKSK
jgi:hypothetical protein